MKSTINANPVANILRNNPFDSTAFAKAMKEAGSKAETYIDTYKGSVGDVWGATAIFREALDGDDALVKINAILNAVSPEKRSVYLNVAFKCMLEKEEAAPNVDDALREYKEEVKKWYDGVAKNVTKEMNKIASSDLTRQEKQKQFAMQTQSLRDANSAMNQKIADAAEYFTREAERPFDMMVGLLSGAKIEPSKRQEFAGMMLDHAINGDKPRAVLKVLLLTNIDSLKLLESRSEKILQVATEGRTAITKDKTYDQIRDVVEAGLGDRSFVGKLFGREVKNAKLSLFNMQSVMLYHSVVEAGLVDVSSKDAVVNNLLVKFNAIMPDFGKGKKNPVISEADLDKSLIESVQRMIDRGNGKQAAELACKIVMMAAHDKISQAIANKNVGVKEFEESSVSPVTTPKNSPELKPRALDGGLQMIDKEVEIVYQLSSRISKNLRETFNEFVRPAVRSQAKVDVMRDIFRPIASEYVSVSGKIGHEFKPSEKAIKDINECLNKSGDKEANIKAAFVIAIKDFESSIDKQCGKYFGEKIEAVKNIKQQPQQQGKELQR